MDLAVAVDNNIYYDGVETTALVPTHFVRTVSISSYELIVYIFLYLLAPLLSATNTSLVMICSYAHKEMLKLVSTYIILLLLPTVRKTMTD